MSVLDENFLHSFFFQRSLPAVNISFLQTECWENAIKMFPVPREKSVSCHSFLSEQALIYQNEIAVLIIQKKTSATLCIFK